MSLLCLFLYVLCLTDIINKYGLYKELRVVMID